MRLATVVQNLNTIVTSFALVFLYACSTQDVSNLRSDNSEIDKEDFIAYPPLPGTGTYLTVDNARARCKTKSIASDEFEVSCSAVVWVNGQEFVTGALKSGTKISWSLPTSKEDKFNFSSSCHASSEIVQTCRIKTANSNRLSFGFEISDEIATKSANFEVLLPFSVTLTGGFNIYRKIFQSPDSISSNPASLNLNNANEARFGFQSTQRSAFEQPLIIDGGSCTSKLGYFYAKGHRIFRIADGKIELFANPDLAGGVPSSRMDSRHVFSTPACTSNCMKLACSDEGVYAYQSSAKKLFYIPENGEVKDLFGNETEVPPVGQLLLVGRGKDDALIFNLSNTIIYKFKDKKFEVLLNTSSDKKSITSLESSEIAQGIDPNEVSISSFQLVKSDSSGNILIRAPFLNPGSNSVGQAIWRLSNNKLYVLAATDGVSLDGVATINNLNGIYDLLPESDSKALFLTADRKIYQIENGSITEVWNNGGSNSAILNMHWEDISKSTVILNYANRMIKRATLGKNEEPTMAGGTDTTRLYKDLFKDGPRDAHTTPIGDPQSLVMDKAGNIFYVDRVQNSLMKIDTLGKIHMLAGGSQSGALLGSGNLSQLTLNKPFGINLTQDETLIVADSLNRRILGIKDGEFWTIAGGGSQGLSCASNGVGANSVVIQNAGALAITPDGRIFYPDWEQYCIYEISSYKKDDVRTVRGILGSGTKYTFTSDLPSIPASEYNTHKPAEVVLLKNGDMLVSEYQRGRIVRVAMNGANPVSVSLYVGGGPGNGTRTYSGPATDVRFATMSRMSVGEDDSVYFVGVTERMLRRATRVNGEMVVEPILGHLPQTECGFGSIDGSASAGSIAGKMKNNLSVICSAYIVAVYIKENCAVDPASNVKMVFSQRFTPLDNNSAAIDFDNGNYIIQTEWPCKAAAPSPIVTQ